MVLSEEKKASLELRYEIWGLDEVRKELERDDRDQFADPEVSAFAWEWVNAQESRILRFRRFWQFTISIAGFVCLGFFLGLAF